MSLRVIFAGTPEFAREILQALLDTPHSIEAVLTQPDRPKGRGRKLSQSPVKQLASHHRLPVLQVTSLKHPEIQKTLRDLKPDIILVVAYGLILPKEVLQIPKYGCLNVHASLLPRFRGAAPIQHSILAGDALSGVTIMQMDAGLDTGDILTVFPCPIEIRETSESLYRRLSALGATVLINTLAQLEMAAIVPQKQDPHHATYAPKINKQDANIIWSESALIIDRKVRAFNPWPVAFTKIEDQSLRIYGSELPESHIDIQFAHATPGTIVNIGKEGIDVATGDGTLRITELQWAGGKRMLSNLAIHSKKELFKIGKILGE